jgi:hypothetical protein
MRFERRMMDADVFPLVVELMSMLLRPTVEILRAQEAATAQEDAPENVQDNPNDAAPTVPPPAV